MHYIITITILLLKLIQQLKYTIYKNNIYYNAIDFNINII